MSEPESFPIELNTDELPAHPRARKMAITRQASFADAAAAVDSLLKAALASRGPIAFLEFLEFACRVRRMALFNALMVKIQRPGCVLAATRRDWAQLGRQPFPDAVPMVMLRPFGPLNFAYDIDDTGGAPMPQEGHQFFQAAGQVSPLEFRRVIKLADEHFIRVEETDQYGTALAGTAAAINLMPEELADGSRWRIRFSSRMSPAQKFATLAHELGHVFCGHLGRHPLMLWPSRRGLSLAQREIEAESVAWLVCQRRGVTPKSAEYLHSLVRDHPQLDEVSLWAIFSAASRIEAGAKRRDDDE